MKRILTVFLVLCFLLAATGCAGIGNQPESILFYYPRTPENYEYGTPDGVISSETRDPAGYRNNLRYLLTLYLRGPVDEKLVSLIPEGSQIMELNRTESDVTMTFNSTFTSLQGLDLTLTCVCLARTCFALTEVATVRIMAQSTDGSIVMDETLTRQQLVTFDTPLPTESTT